MNNLLEDDISKSNNNIFILIKSPREYIKNKINTDYSEKTKTIATQTYFENLEKEINNFINKIPNKLEELKNNVEIIEKAYMEEEEKNAIDKEIQNLNQKIDNYNTIKGYDI